MKILTILGARPQFIKAGTDKKKILNSYKKHSSLNLYGDGNSSNLIIRELLKCI